MPYPSTYPSTYPDGTGGGGGGGGGETSGPVTSFFDGVKRPRIQLLAGFGGTLDPGTDYLHLGVGPGLGTAKLGGVSAGVNEIDITPDLRSISLDLLGPPTDIDAADPVTATFVLSNRHGNYDPTNPASPYNGQLDDGTPIRLRYTWGGVAYNRFYGELAGIVLDLDYTPDATAAFTCRDGLEKLGRAYLPTLGLPDRDGDRTGTRINYLADQAAYPSALRSIDTGYTTLASTVLGEFAAELMHQVENTEFGALFVDGGGVLVFYDRHRGALSSRSTSVQATFTDSGAAGTVKIPALALSRNRERSFNRVAITRDPIPSAPVIVGDGNLEESPDEPVEQVADDIAAQIKGVLAFPAEVGQLHRNDHEALAMAQYLVARFKTTQNRISEIQVNMLRGGWDQLLPLGPLDRVAVSRNYGPNTISTQLLIQGVGPEEVTVEPPSWSLTFTTSNPPPTPTLWTLGTSALGSGHLGW